MSLDYQDRLRQGSFVSPSGIEIEFLTNTLNRKSGKKVSTQEIIDSDESVSQDQGNKTDIFPINMYFVDDDFDLTIRDFESLLKERYTLSTPGILKHPLWGDINVFPTSWETSIELIDGVGVGRMDVEFVQVFKTKYPESTLNNVDNVGSDLDDMSFIDSAAQLAVSAASAASNVAGKISAVVGVVISAVDFVESVADEITAIQDSISNLIDNVAGNIISLLFTVQRLMRAPDSFIDSTMNKINVYKGMCDDIIATIKDEKETDPVNLRNNAVLMQTFAGFAVGCLAEASLYTTYSIRSDAISAIQTIETALENYNIAMSDIRTDGNAEKEYSGDHNFYSLLFGVIARTRDILLNQSFQLKSEKKFKLTENSDIITLCYQYYGAVDSDTILFFVTTNKICCDEFIELAAGREVVFYV